MTQETLLAIDCGTQSLRAILFTRDGEMAECAKIDYEPYVSPFPGWAEQDPELYWNSLLSALNLLKTKSPQHFEAIAGVGLTAQRASMINVDKQGIPLRPCMLWLDQRRAKPVWSRKWPMRLGLKLTGLKRKSEDIETQGKCNWIRQNQPEIWANTFKYLQVSGFLNYRLTGEFKDSTASQIGHIPFNYRTQKWAGPFQLAAMVFPVETVKLPALVQPGSLLGRITEKASLASGIKAGIPVIACGSDKGCETLGTGAVSPDTVSLSFGTTATVQTTSSAYLEVIPHMPAYPSPMSDMYNPEVEIFRGFWMISWFKKEFAHKEVEEARRLGIPAEEVLNRCLEKTPPGAMGLIVQPYWGAGLGLPHAKGAMIGFGDIHTKDHIYRAVIEGLGFGLREGIEKIEGKTRVPVVRAAVSGGASQSDEICRIMANITRLPMIKGRTHETSGLGAAILTARGLGWYPDLDSAVKHMVHTGKMFHPDPEAVRIYQALYEKVYSRMYAALKPLYSEIRNITGYPE